jgi:ATP-binding cassette subfamily G (WHITE) protein 2 (SNQ2)
MYADASIGSLGVELSKRTTIGVELAAKVSFGTHRRSHLANDLRKPKLLLFLDEPTSGLDSQSAWSIMSFLRNLADHGQAILCTCVLSYFTSFGSGSDTMLQDSSGIFTPFNCPPHILITYALDIAIC